MHRENIEISEREFNQLIETNLSRAGYFSCVVLYEHRDFFAWCTALRIGEMMKDSFNPELRDDITIHLVLKVSEIMDKLKEMQENDILILSMDNPLIEPLAQYLSREIMIEKKNLIFVSKNDNPLIKPIEGITRIVMLVNNQEDGELTCIINISEGGERELSLTLPDRSLINRYRGLRSALMRESIHRQVPELGDD